MNISLHSHWLCNAVTQQQLKMYITSLALFGGNWFINFSYRGDANAVLLISSAIKVIVEDHSIL